MATVNGVATFLPGRDPGRRSLHVPRQHRQLRGKPVRRRVRLGRLHDEQHHLEPVVWTALGTGIPAGGFCGVQAAVSAGTPTFYAQTGCLGVFETGGNRGPFQLWRLVGTTGAWDRIDDNFWLLRASRSSLSTRRTRTDCMRRIFPARRRANDLLHGRRHELGRRRRPDRADGRTQRLQDAAHAGRNQFHGLHRLRPAEPRGLRPGGLQCHRRRWARFGSVPVSTTAA